MLTQAIVQGLREKYAHLHPLILTRSIERARTDVELFDILDSIPKKFPLVWSEEEYRWINVEDTFFLEDFLGELE